MLHTLKVLVRDVYGAPTVYPDCDQSRKLAAMLRTKTLTATAIADAKAMGFVFTATGSPHPAFQV